MAEQTKHILIIDDDITSLDLVSFLFEEHGYRVERRSDGQSAIDYTRENSPDLVIVDLMMPGIDGKETVKQIRQLGHTDIPIIAFTAVDDPMVHSEAIDAGCNEVMTKPCPPEKLMKYIQRHLK